MGSTWTQWSPLGGYLTSGPDAASPGDGRLEVFVRGGDSQLWQRSWDASSWSAWEPLGGALTSDPGAVSWGTNRVDVFMRGTNQALWHKGWNGSS